MLSASDFIRLPYTPDLSQSGIAYACRSLHYTYNRMGGSLAKRMRRIAGGIAVELAFRRYLHENKIPFDVLGMTPFTDPDNYDVSLGGRRCDIKSFILSRREEIRRLRRDPEAILDAAALVPADQFAAEGHSDSELYLFAFLFALSAESLEAQRKALEAGNPIHLIHVLPRKWARPRVWHPLGKLVLKSEDEMPLTLELGGQDSEGDFLSEKIELPPRTRVAVRGEFHTLLYLHPETRPARRIGVYSPILQETYLVPSSKWSNIYLYGMEILFLGYLTRGEFRRRAAILPAGSRVLQYRETRVKNLAVPVRDLRPLASLFERVRIWEAEKSTQGESL